MNKKTYGMMGLVLLATTGSVWAGLPNQRVLSSEKKGYHWNPEKQGYHWCQDIKQNQLQKPPMPSENEMMSMHPEELRKLHEAHRTYSVHTGLSEDIDNCQKVQNVIVKKALRAAGVKETTYRQSTSASNDSVMV